MLDLGHEPETILVHLECRILICPFVAFLPVCFHRQSAPRRTPGCYDNIYRDAQKGSLQLFVEVDGYCISAVGFSAAG